MKKYILFLLIPFLFCPFFNLRAEVINDLSFMPENVWYSGGELKDGEVVNIHTAIWNGLDDKVVMKIDFYDKDTLLGARDLSIEPKDLSEVSISWRVTAGEHYISAKIVSPKSIVDGIEKDVKVSSNKTKIDRQKISVVIKDQEGEEVKTKDALGGILGQAEEKVKDILNEDVEQKVSIGFEAIEKYRLEKAEQVKGFEEEMKEKIDDIKSKDEEDQEGLAGYNVKFYFWQIIHFIFANKIAFYVVSGLLLLFILRAIYRAFRHRT
jgi:hypothetical protein